MASFLFNTPIIVLIPHKVGAVMSEHYYSSQPQSEMKTETKTFTLKNHSFTFTMSSGVFSKKGIDFGSKLLIENFQLPKVDGYLLDLGCGYGPIGLVLAKEHQDRTIVMIDINERAIRLANHNRKENQLNNVQVKKSDGYESLAGEKFAAIITNPPIRAGKKKVYQLLQSSIEHLVNEGELWIVVQKKQGAPSMISYLETLVPKVDIITRKKGYFIIRATKTLT